MPLNETAYLNLVDNDLLPEKAAENIKAAAERNLPPDGYASIEAEIRESEQDRTVATSKPVIETIAKSEQHQAVVKDDIDTFNKLQRYLEFSGAVIRGVDLSGDLFQLSYKKASGQELTREENFELIRLNKELQRLNNDKEEYGYDFTDSLAAEGLAGGGYQFLQSLWRGRDLTVKGALIGGGGGAVLGLGGGLPGIGAGALHGGFSGASVGTQLGLIRDAYQQSAGQIYNDLTYVIKDRSDLAEDKRKDLAIGGGLVMSMVAFLPVGAIARGTPFVNKLASARILSKYLLSAEGATMRQFLISLGRTGLAEGIEEGSQEIVQAVTTEVGKTWDGSETSLIQGFNNAMNTETVKNAIKAGAIGTVAGVGIQAGLSTAGTVLEKGVQRVQPEAPPTQQETGPTDLVGDEKTVNTFAKGVRAIQLKVAIDQSTQLTQETNTNQLIPQEMDEIRQKMFEDAGMSHVYVDKEELDAWANTEKRLEKIRSIFGDKELAEAEFNAPLRIEIYKFMRIAEDDPTVTDLIKAYPEGPSVQQHLDRVEQAERQRKAIQDLIPDARIPDLPAQIPLETQQQIADQVAAQEANITGAKEGLRQAEEAYKKAEDPATRQTIQSQIDGFKADISASESRIEALKTYETSQGEFRTRDEDIFGEDPYLEQPTFTEEMYKVIPKAELLKLNEAQLTTRTEIADSIQAESELALEEVTKLETYYEEMLAEKEQQAKYESPEQLQLVEDYLEGNRILEPTKEQQELIDKGVPVHRIDPRTLTKEMREKYEKNPTLRKRKVFKQGENSAELVAAYYGVRSVGDLLDTLANTPTREEQVQRNEEIRKTRNRLDELSNEKIDSTKTVKGYENLSKIHIKELKILLNKYWPAVRKGIERVALDIPKLRSILKKQAKDEVGRTKVKDLKVNRYKVAERKSQRKAVQAILRNEIERALREKQNAAYSSNLVAETHSAIGKVNRALKFISSLNTPEIRAILNEAGKNYTETVDYFLELYNFSPNRRNQDRVDRYNKFVKDQVKKGNTHFEIPPEVQAWLTPQIHADELTVDQLLYIEDYLKSVVKQARLKNKLLAKQETRTIEMIEDFLEELAKENPDYKEGRAVEKVGDVKYSHMLTEFFGGLESLVTNNQFIWQSLDGKIDGPWAQIFHAPLVGAGRYEGLTGLLANSRMAGKLKASFDKLIKKHYGKKSKFLSYSAETIDIPEFSKLPNFNEDGRVSKSELLMLLLNMGNEENRSRVSNFKIDPDRVMEILQRELSEADFDFAQGIWNLFKSFTPRLVALEKETTGRDLQLVQPESFEAFGKTYSGGYFPIALKRSLSYQDINDKVSELYKGLADRFSLETPTEYRAPHPAYEGIVRSPHTKERVGTDTILDLDISRMSQSFDDLIWDLSMRQPVRDVMTLLVRPKIKAAIIAQIGHMKYNTLVGNVANLTKSITADNVRIHNVVTDTLMGIFRHIDGAYTINYIAFNASSVLMSALALPNIMFKMGVKNAAKHLGAVTLKSAGAIVAGDFDFLGKSIDLAAEASPSIRLYREGLDDYRATAIGKMIPRKRVIKSKKYDTAKRIFEGTGEYALSGILGGADTLIRTYAYLGVRNMYLAGDAEGHSYESVHKGKTPEEINAAANSYAAQFLENTTMQADIYSKSVLQQTEWGRLITRFWNEPRNVLNNQLQTTRDIRKSSKEVVKHTKNGDFVKANEAFYESGAKAANWIWFLLVTQMVYNLAKYGAPFIIDDEEEEHPKEQDISLEAQWNAAPKFFKHHLLTPDGFSDLFTQNLFGNIPIVRDMIYSSKSAYKTAVPSRSVSYPLLQAGTDIVTTGNLTAEVYQMWLDGMEFGEIWEDLKPQEQRAFLNTIGYSWGTGLPGLNQILKLKERADEYGDAGVNLSFVNKQFIENVDRFLKKNEKERQSEAFRKLKKLKNAPKSERQALLDDMRAIRNKIAPVPKGQPLSEEGYEIIKAVESRGKWNESPETSNAFGLYQFIPSTWRYVMNTPEGRAAGLTESGRLARNPKQQETAMRIWSKRLAKELSKNNIEVSLETIYFGHHFGIGAINKYGRAVFMGPPNKNIPKGFLTPEIKLANPWTERVKTNADMVKELRRLLKRGEQIMLERKR